MRPPTLSVALGRDQQIDVVGHQDIGIHAALARFERLSGD